MLCKFFFVGKPKVPNKWPFDVAEIAIVSTELAELLGSAIALNLLFPQLPLWAGVLITPLDVLIILAISDGHKGRPARLFELIIVALVCSVLDNPTPINSKSVLSRFSLCSFA